MAFPAPFEAARPFLEAVFGYLKEHPEELVRALKNTLALRFGVPIPALRWLAHRGNGRRAPRDLEISAVPPGVRVGASFDLMKTPLRGTADVFIERVDLGPERLLLEIRLANVALAVQDERVETPLASLLRSGALDLSRPGNLVAYMPKRPPFLIEAKDDRVVIDLLQHPRVGSGKIKRWVGRIVPFVTVRTIETDHHHLDVELRPFPDGVRQSFETVRRAF